MKKIDISFINYGGLSYGGAHKQSIELAKVLDKNIFNIRYFWCEHNHDKYSDFTFPKQDRSFLVGLKKHGVETVEFKVAYRDISDTHHVWKNTNFFEIYEKFPTDINFCVRAGRQEFPTLHIDKPLIEWNVFGCADTESDNLVYSVGVSPWVQKTYLENGGDGGKSGYCFYGLDDPKTNRNLRDYLKIDDKQIVIGFHQRDDDNIFSEHALNAWSSLTKKTKKNVSFLILGGSKKYKKLAVDLNINVFFLPIVFNSTEVSKFLNTLDIFSHSAGAGESLGIAVQEAMLHKLPVVSMYGKNNGHIDVIGDTIEIAKTEEDYQRILYELVENDEHRELISSLSYKRAKKTFSAENMKNYFEKLFLEKYLEYKNTNFETTSISIHEKFSFRRSAYRLFYKYSFLMKTVTFLYLKIKKTKNLMRKLY